MKKKKITLLLVLFSNELWGNDNPHDTWFFDIAKFSFVAQQYMTKKDNYYTVTPLFVEAVLKYKKQMDGSVEWREMK